MKFVEIYKIQNNGTQRIAVVCRLVGKTAVCEGDKVLVKNLEQDGIWDSSKMPSLKIFPGDGINFLEKLRFVFTSGYLNASEVKEKQYLKVI